MAKRTSPLISAPELHATLGQKSLKIFDVGGAWGEPAITDAFNKALLFDGSFLAWKQDGSS